MSVVHIVSWDSFQNPCTDSTSLTRVFCFVDRFAQLQDIDLTNVPPAIRVGT